MKCKICGDSLRFVDHLGHDQGPDYLHEALGQCRPCWNKEKKRCKCGEWHLLPTAECLKCFLEKWKEQKKNEST